MTKKPYLIQNSTFKEDVHLKDTTGIDSILSFDYMGSSEFEWGALPKSLKRILWLNGDYTFHTIEELKNTEGIPTTIYCIESELDNVIKNVEHLSKNKYGYKEVCSFANWFDKKSNDAYNRRNQFWWDIENDYFVYFGGKKVKGKVKKSQHEKVVKAIEEMKKREVLK